MKVFLTPAMLSAADERDLDQILIDALRAEFRKDRAAMVGTQAGTGRLPAAPAEASHVVVERRKGHSVDAMMARPSDHDRLEPSIKNFADDKARAHTKPSGNVRRRQRPLTRAERRSPATTVSHEESVCRK